MIRPNRRTFLAGSAAALGANLAIGGTKASGRILGANDTVRVAVAGLNGRGGSHLDEFAGMEGVQVTHVIDPDRRTHDRAIKAVVEKGRNTPEAVADVRRVLDMKDVDVLSIAAPNHWHSLMTCWACQAGKDVYVEKPLSHDVNEGRVAVALARKHGRIVQHGTQGRSEKRWAQVAEIARTGKLGKLLVSRALCYKPRPSIGVQPDAAAPAELDYDLWLGPAEARPFNGNYVHYNWHWFWPFGNGDIGNQGVHQFDIARWMIPGATLPTRVQSLGGRFGYADQGETPNTMVTAMEFGPTTLIFEVRGLPTDDYKGEKVGNILHFEGGVVTNSAFYPEGSEAEAPLPAVEASRGPGAGHFANFIVAVRSRKVEDLNADIQEGHFSSALCHLANISYRLGIAGGFRGEAAAPGGSAGSILAEAVDRTVAHLTEGNGLDRSALTFRFGPALSFDPQAERFTGDRAAEANLFLSRAYRAAYALPDATA